MFVSFFLQTWIIMEKKIRQPSEQGKQRAERIKYLRIELLDNISRPKFAKKHGISKGSLQNWEDVRYGGLTENGAQELLEAFQSEGINCTLEWLLYGKGETPFRQSFLDKILSQPLAKSDEALLTEELQVFYKLHQNAVDMIIHDDALAPCFLPGFHVAGEKLFSQDIYKAIGTACIVQLQNGTILTRVVTAGSLPEHYTLVSTNPQTTVEEPIIKNIKLFSAAPIFWIRKPKLS